MAVTVFLAQHGETEWDLSGRITGEADVTLSSTGRAQTQALQRVFRGIFLAEVLSSPLLCATATAEPIADGAGITILRDPRLADARAGVWSGRLRSELEASAAFQRFRAQPLEEKLYGHERLFDVMGRAVRSLEQALAESGTSDNLLLVTHGFVIKLLLTHYLGRDLARYDEIETRPGAVSVLAADRDLQHPQVIATNLSPPELEQFIDQAGLRTATPTLPVAEAPTVPVETKWHETEPIIHGHGHGHGHGHEPGSR